MDTKYYVEWRERIKKWVVLYGGNVQGQFDTKEQAQDWAKYRFSGHGHESERVRVRRDSPKGAKRGEWM